MLLKKLYLYKNKWKRLWFARSKKTLCRDTCSFYRSEECLSNTEACLFMTRKFKTVNYRYFIKEGIRAS